MRRALPTARYPCDPQQRWRGSHQFLLRTCVTSLHHSATNQGPIFESFPLGSGLDSWGKVHDKRCRFGHSVGTKFNLPALALTMVRLRIDEPLNKLVLGVGEGREHFPGVLGEEPLTTTRSF